MNQHPHEDIRFQAKKMFDAIQVPLSWDEDDQSGHDQNPTIVVTPSEE